jgi:hypothetical protein
MRHELLGLGKPQTHCAHRLLNVVCHDALPYLSL